MECQREAEVGSRKREREGRDEKAKGRESGENMNWRKIRRSGTKQRPLMSSYPEIL